MPDGPGSSFSPAGVTTTSGWLKVPETKCAYAVFVEKQSRVVLSHPLFLHRLLHVPFPNWGAGLHRSSNGGAPWVKSARVGQRSAPRGRTLRTAARVCGLIASGRSVRSLGASTGRRRLIDTRRCVDHNSLRFGRLLCRRPVHT
jgi:hypothetical protein